MYQTTLYSVCLLMPHLNFDLEEKVVIIGTVSCCICAEPILRKAKTHIFATLFPFFSGTANERARRRDTRTHNTQTKSKAKSSSIFAPILFNILSGGKSVQFRSLHRLHVEEEVSQANRSEIS